MLDSKRWHGSEDSLIAWCDGPRFGESVMFMALWKGAVIMVLTDGTI